MDALHLKPLPDTNEWNKVVRLLAEDASIPEIVDATLDASEKGLLIAYEDPGIAYIVQRLSNSFFISGMDDWRRFLQSIDVSEVDDLEMLTLIAKLSCAMDNYLHQMGRRSNLAEMARLAATESLVSALQEVSDNFQSHRWKASSSRRMLTRRLRRPRSSGDISGIDELVYDFFGRFMHRFLMYHLSRELSFHVSPNGRFGTPSAHNEFIQNLQAYCRETSLSILNSPEDRKSLALYKGTLTRQAAEKFTPNALKDLRSGLKIRGDQDV